MASAADHVLSAVVFGVIAIVAGGFVRVVSPRKVGLLIGEAIMLLSAGCCLTTLIVPVSMTYTAGPHLQDLFVLWPAALSMVAIAFIPTRQRKQENTCECGYNLSGNTSGKCPECGRWIRAEHSSRRANLHAVD